MIIHYIPIDNFTNANSHIKWHRTDFINELSQLPILLVQLALEENINYVVIDGNHRLTKWIGNVTNIPCYILDMQWIIDNDMFYSDFSKLMYIFQNELSTFTVIK